MTYEELKKEHILNCYGKFSCVEIMKAYPDLLHFGTSKKYLEYDNVAKLTFFSLSFAKNNKITVFPHIVGFFHTHYGCTPLFASSLNVTTEEGLNMMEKSTVNPKIMKKAVAVVRKMSADERLLFEIEKLE